MFWRFELPIDNLMIVEIDNTKYSVPRNVDIGSLVEVLQQLRPVYFHWGNDEDTRYHYIDHARVPDIGIKQAPLYSIKRHKADQKREEEL
jgi:hypothetical protein